MSRWARPTRVAWWASGVAVAITVATTAFLAAMYASLPRIVPVRFEHGQPIIYQFKSPLVVLLPAIVQAALLIVFGAVMLLLLWRARPIAAHDAAAVERSATMDAVEADSFRMRLAAEGIALLATVWIFVQAFGAVCLIVLWRRGVGGYGELYTFAIITAVTVSIVIGARTMKLVGSDRRTPPAVDPGLWRLRNLYVNPADPALFVPTRTGVGWTLNFGRPVSIVLLGATLILGIGGPYVFARYVLRAFSFD